MNLQRNLEESILPFSCMYQTRVNIIYCTSMFDSIVDELICYEDESSSPERMNMVCIENLSYKITDNFRLTIVGSKIYLTVYLMNISKT